MSKKEIFFVVWNKTFFLPNAPFLLWGIEPGTFDSRCRGLNQYATPVRDYKSSREYVLLKTQRLNVK